MTTIVGILAIFAALIFSRPFTTLVHEIGHALPALAFTNKPVTIYVGSYGDIKKSWQLNLGRLLIIFTPKIFDLQLGLCSHYPAKRIYQSMLIVLGGPIFSLLLGLSFAFFILDFKDQQYAAFAMAIFLVSGIFDFIGNIIPSKDPLVTHDGRTTYNDGYQFQQLLTTSRYPAVYFEGIEALNNNDFELGVSKLLATADSGVTSSHLYQEIIQVLTAPEVKNKGLLKAISFHERYSSQFKLDSQDFKLAGDLYQKVEENLKAITHYSKAIELSYKNVDALFQRGKILHQLGYDIRAASDFKKVLSLDEQHKGAKRLLTE